MHDRNLMNNPGYGFTLQELNFPFDTSKYPEAATAYLELISVTEYLHLNELATHVIEGH